MSNTAAQDRKAQQTECGLILLVSSIGLEEDMKNLSFNNVCGFCAVDLVTRERHDIDK